MVLHVNIFTLILIEDTIKIEHIANQRKLEYYIDLHNREEKRLEVEFRKYQEENMSYEKEIKELINFYKIEENLKTVDISKGKKNLHEIWYASTLLCQVSGVLHSSSYLLYFWPYGQKFIFLSKIISKKLLYLPCL